jgi:hypothetical protein
MPGRSGGQSRCTRALSGADGRDGASTRGEPRVLSYKRFVSREALLRKCASGSGTVESECCAYARAGFPQGTWKNRKTLDDKTLRVVSDCVKMRCWPLAAGRSGSLTGPYRLPPNRPAGYRQLLVAAFTGDARALPGRPRRGHQRLQGYRTPLVLRSKETARVDAQKRVPSQPGDAPQQPPGIPATIRQDKHGPGAWDHPVRLA